MQQLLHPHRAAIGGGSRPLVSSSSSSSSWHAAAAAAERGSSRRRRVLHCARALRKIGNNPQRSAAFELNLERLASDSYAPARQIGPVEVAAVPGQGRGVLAKEHLAPGSLLFVAQPVGGALLGQPGQQLQPQHLQVHLAQLAEADRQKLSLLHSPGAPPPPAASFKDFSSSKAAAKAQKQRAAAKGFAAPKQAAAAQAAATQLDEQQLAALLACNAYGDDHLDAALTLCRGEQQASVIGVWPELALLNHSCVPNTAPPVLLASGALLLRTAVTVPAGEQLTTSYLGLAGGMPAPQRQALLQQHYGFECGCHRCKAEAAAPPGVAESLQAAHAWSSALDTPQLLRVLAAGDAAAVAALRDAASQHVECLEQQLSAMPAQEPVVAQWLRASAHGAYAVLHLTSDWLSGLRLTDAAQQLAELVQVFEPASEPHLLLLAESAVRASEAAARSEAPSSPGEAPELRVQRLVRAVVLRYGEPRELALLTRLTGAVAEALSPNWLGLIDLHGQLGLQEVLRAAAAQGIDGDDGGSKRKVELRADQLPGMLGQ